MCACALRVRVRPATKRRRTLAYGGAVRNWGVVRSGGGGGGRFCLGAGGGDMLGGARRAGAGCMTGLVAANMHISMLRREWDGFHVGVRLCAGCGVEACAAAEFGCAALTTCYSETLAIYGHRP